MLNPMDGQPTRHDADDLAAARRELHELAILSGALARLATKVHSRCEDLRLSLGVTEVGRPDPPVELVRAPDPAEEPPEEPAGGPGAVQPGELSPAELLAMSMAGSGSTREEIEQYLRDAFGMQDAHALVDRVLPRR